MGEVAAEQLEQSSASHDPRGVSAALRVCFTRLMKSEKKAFVDQLNTLVQRISREGGREKTSRAAFGQGGEAGKGGEGSGESPTLGAGMGRWGWGGQGGEVGMGTPERGDRNGEIGMGRPG